MVFRRIYWVTEQLSAEGVSDVTGVYTSIPDLMENGMRWLESNPKRDGFRITLVKLDSSAAPLGVWSGPSYLGIEEDLAPYVATKEFSAQDVEALAAKLRSF